MLVEFYIFRFLFYCFLAFFLGLITIFLTITKGDHPKGGFDFFYIFKKLKLTNLLENIWSIVVSFIKFLTGFNLEK